MPTAPALPCGGGGGLLLLLVVVVVAATAAAAAAPTHTYTHVLKELPFSLSSVLSSVAPTPLFLSLVAFGSLLFACLALKRREIN